MNHTLETTQWSPPIKNADSDPNPASQTAMSATPASGPIALAERPAVPAVAKQVAPIYARCLVDRTIRLLKIGVGSGEGIVNCSLVEASLASNPVFEAISYHWGDAEEKIDITCNGTTIGIIRNLYQVLWQMRQEQKLGYFWADAVCINQSDDVEKTSQVQMMRDIYASASNVLVWLGPEQPTDCAAIELVKRVYDTLGAPNLPITSGGRHEKLPDLGLPAFYENAWIPLRNVFQ